MLGSQTDGETPPVSTKKPSDFGMTMYEFLWPGDRERLSIVEDSRMIFPKISVIFPIWLVVPMPMNSITQINGDYPPICWTDNTEYFELPTSWPLYIMYLYHKPPLNLGRKRLGQVSNNISKRYSAYTITSTFWLNSNLVGGFNPSEKYESQLGLLFPTYGKIIQMFQTTNQ